MTKREARRLALIAAAELIEHTEPGDIWDDSSDVDFYDLSTADQTRFTEAYEAIATAHRAAAQRLTEGSATDGR